MADALLSPYNTGQAVELSTTLFRKPLLKLGSINYKGKKLTFDRKYLRDLKDSFTAGAYDQVPFQLADGGNAHNEDPERFRGDVKGFELTKDGLDVLVDFTPKGAELIRDNPKLGVSARIIEGLEHSDGRKYDRAVRHVLGTLDPKVTGLGAWQEVTLSADDAVDNTIDVTQEEVTTLVPEGTPSGTGGAPPPSSTATVDDGGGGGDAAVGTTTLIQPPAPGVTVNVNTPAGTSADPAPVPGFEDLDFDDITDEELDELVDASASLSNEHQDDEPSALDLANARVAAVEAELARQRFVNLSREYIEAGVPPVMVELARPILSMPMAPVIDLANNEQLDFGELVTDMLDQCKGFIQLGREQGSSATDDPPEQSAANVLERFRKVGK
jgi:hypothetical protein